jgi:hypothetical protein
MVMLLTFDELDEPQEEDQWVFLRCRRMRRLSILLLY